MTNLKSINLATSKRKLINQLIDANVLMTIKSGQVNKVAALNYKDMLIKNNSYSCLSLQKAKSLLKSLHSLCNSIA